jgi:Putative peptidoglycan binding domain
LSSESRAIRSSGRLGGIPRRSSSRIRTICPRRTRRRRSRLSWRPPRLYHRPLPCHPTRPRAQRPPPWTCRQCLRLRSQRPCRPPAWVAASVGPLRACLTKSAISCAGNLSSTTRGLISTAQGALAKLGYPVKVDGAEDGATRRALRDFERAHGLPLRTEISSQLVKQLTAVVRLGQKGQRPVLTTDSSQ